MRWLYTFALILALALTACGGGRAVVAPTATVTPLRSATSSANAPVSAAPTGNVGDRPEVAAQITTYLKEGFGIPGATTTWYPAIISVHVAGDTVNVATSLSPGEKATATGICSGTSGFVFANPNAALGLKRVRVLAQDGSVIIDRRDVSGRCS